MNHDASVTLVVEVRRARDVVQGRRFAADVVLQLAGVGHEPHVHVVSLWHMMTKKNQDCGDEHRR